jgi:anti-anti-sigma regulatory factor
MLAMLRISIDEANDLITMKLEGKIKGAWVKELERTWSAVRSRPERKPVRVDLRQVGFVDDCGLGALIAMRQEGVELVASGPLMSSVVEEVIRRAENADDALKIKAANA